MVCSFLSGFSSLSSRFNGSVGSRFSSFLHFASSLLSRVCLVLDSSSVGSLLAGRQRNESRDGSEHNEMFHAQYLSFV